MMCGRCQLACPVGINIKDVRLISRNKLNGHPIDKNEYVKTIVQPVKADVLYFGGCMTHQTPAIKKSMTTILKSAGVDFWFMDEQGGICCGRPSILTGHIEQAKAIISSNVRIIQQSGAKKLVTSCPICYKVFRQDYNLDIEILHHSQYIQQLMDEGRLEINRLGARSVYHDPCELSREIRVYDEPRNVLERIVDLVPSSYDKDDSLCCGGSLANLSISMEKRFEITQDAIFKLTQGNPEMLITSCPQCKKTFEKASGIPVKDLAEIVCQALTGLRKPLKKANKQKKQLQATDFIMGGAN